MLLRLGEYTLLGEKKQHRSFLFRKAPTCSPERMQIGLAWRFAQWICKISDLKFIFSSFFMQSEMLHNLVQNSSLKNNRGTSVSPSKKKQNEICMWQQCFTG